MIIFLLERWWCWLTKEAALPVDENTLQSLTLHILQVDLNLPEQEIVWLRVTMAQRQDLLTAGLVQNIEDVEQSFVNFSQKCGVIQQSRV